MAAKLHANSNGRSVTLHAYTLTVTSLEKTCERMRDTLNALKGMCSHKIWRTDKWPLKRTQSY